MTVTAQVPDDGPPDLLELRVPAAGAYVSLVRTVTAAAAARCDLVLDDIEDLRIAVDEACTLLLSTALPGAELHVRFTLSRHIVIVSVAADAHDGGVDTGGLAWTLIGGLVDGCEVTHVAGQVAVTLTKRPYDPVPGAGHPPPSPSLLTAR